MAKNGVDGVYTADPKLFPQAEKYDLLTYMEMIQQGLGVMDTTATSMCMDNDIDLIVFNMNECGNIKKAVAGEIIGTRITKESKK
jgi:uridylate kinase